MVLTLAFIPLKIFFLKAFSELCPQRELACCQRELAGNLQEEEYLELHESQDE